MEEKEPGSQRRSPGRGAERDSAPRFLTIGRVLGPFGTQGELRVQILTEFPERFEQLRTVYLNEVRYEVERSWLHRGSAILKLSGVGSPEDAGKLRGQLVEVPREEAVPLPPGHYYDYQVLGLRVVTAAGEEVGKVEDILHTGANDVLIVRGPRGEVLVPVVRSVVKEMDLQQGRIVIEPLPGLLP